MSNLYVIMKEKQNPIYMYVARPHEVCSTLKAAKERVEELNKKRTTNHYWYEKAKIYEG